MVYSSGSRSVKDGSFGILTLMVTARNYVRLFTHFLVAFGDYTCIDTVIPVRWPVLFSQMMGFMSQFVSSANSTSMYARLLSTLLYSCHSYTPESPTEILAEPINVIFATKIRFFK